MPDTIERNAIGAKIISDKHKLLFIVLIICVGLGMGSFLLGILTGSSQKVWQALLVNTLFFTGLAYGCLMFSVILAITNAGWGRPIKRLAEATVLFIPVSWLLFILLMTGMDHFFEWTDPASAIPEKTWWLNLPFFISRNLLLMMTIGIVGIAYVLSSLKPDLILLKKRSPEAIGKLAQKLIGNTNTQEKHKLQFQIWSTRLAPAFAALYVVMNCVLAFDWIMSIDQEWISTAFGFQHVIANFYGAGAFLIIVFSLFRRKKSLKPYLTKERLNDLSRLLFVTSLIWTYLVYSQILVIWYANLPDETSYLLIRMNGDHWFGMFYFLMFCLFLAPFFGLLSKTACRSPLISSSISILVLIGLWCEKFFLIIPSIQENQINNTPIIGLNFNIWDAAVTLGVGAAFLLCFLFFLMQFPILPISDSLLDKETPIST